MKIMRDEMGGNIDRENASCITNYHANFMTFYDIFVQVLTFLRDDRISLYNCALVDWNFNNAASRILYSRICYSPEYCPVLDLKNRGALEVSGLF